ncbi:MAG UNVERIFIED_CONTAM: dihydrofolate reductase family protein [Anaerolineae bacterium]
MGGAQLIRACLDHRLIDEFIVTLTPVILGRASACLSHTPCPPTL